MDLKDYITLQIAILTVFLKTYRIKYILYFFFIIFIYFCSSIKCPEHA